MNVGLTCGKTNFEKACAIAGKYGHKSFDGISCPLIDLEFWQALGKAIKCVPCNEPGYRCVDDHHCWFSLWQVHICRIVQGYSIEEYFEYYLSVYDGDTR